MKSKWNDICKLKGRDRDKNAQKKIFTDMLKRDPLFQESYWDMEVTDKYKKRSVKRGMWQIRVELETQHGGGTRGENSVQNLIDLGVYEERHIKGKDKNGNKICHSDSTEYGPNKRPAQC